MTQFDWAMVIELDLIKLDSIRLALDWLDVALLNDKTCSNWSQGYKIKLMRLIWYRLLLDQILLDNRLDWIKPYY